MNNYQKHIIAFGGGVDSTALCLINIYRNESAKLIGIPREVLDEAFPMADAIMFSDTGAERSATYKNIAAMQRAYGFANRAGQATTFHIVRREKETITDWLLRTGTIPLMPGGSHLCSLKFKTEVMHAQAEKMFPAAKINWSIGIEANEDRRANKSFTDRSNDVHTSVYPLRRLGLDRKACEALIKGLGWLSEVPKSACVFCPFMQIHEIKDLIQNEPDSWALVKHVEANFEATSPRKHGAWIAAGRPLNSAGKALRGMWRKDSWKEGARLFAKRVNGKQMSASEWEAYLTTTTK